MVPFPTPAVAELRGETPAIPDPQEPDPRESEQARLERIALLRVSIAAGAYHVPADELATALFKRSDEGLQVAAPDSR